MEKWVNSGKPLTSKYIEGNPEPSPAEKAGKVQRLKRPPPKATTCLQQEAMVMR
ncbi:MAG: hypothetical protein KKH11_01165 [Candidatus Omnitrophica bacterium]|nr:hypothetical protein [Candidatus Omnitrophota bacterium]